MRSPIKGERVQGDRVNRGVRALIIAGIIMGSLAGCSAKKESVPLMAESREELTCTRALNMDTRQIPDDEFFRILDNSQKGDWLDTCWKPLMVKALSEDRDIPIKHLGRAVHRFNTQETKDAFYMAAFQYFSKIVRGEGEYGSPQKQLLTQYLHLAIRDAGHKNDLNLKKAMLVSARLDPEIYDRFFN